MARRLSDVFLVATGITDKKKKRALLLQIQRLEKCFGIYWKMETMTTGFYKVADSQIKRTFRTSKTSFVRGLSISVSQARKCKEA